MERRRAHRYNLQLPFAVSKIDSQPVSAGGVTKNVSAGGVLFYFENEPTIGTIEYVITLFRDRVNSVAIHCLGNIVRCDRVEDEMQSPNHPPYLIAATVERYKVVREMC